MASKKYPVRGKFGSSAEYIDPVTGQYAGTQYRQDYAEDPQLLLSSSGRRVGPFQFYRRGRYSGKYQSKDARLPGYKERHITGDDSMTMNWDRDTRILICIGTIVAVFIIMFTVMNMVFDSVADLMGMIHLSVTDFNTFRLQASLCFGVVVALIVGSGAAMFLFKEGEVDDSVFQA